MNYHARKRLSADPGMRGRSPYVPPPQWGQISLAEVLRLGGRPPLEDKQLDFLSTETGPKGEVFYAGNLNLLGRPAVSIVGTREVSLEGRQRAIKLTRELVRAGVVIVSGLARGVDQAAHMAAIEEAGGSTIAVIGTPLDKAYPQENASLQEMIYRDHLLISPFASGETVFKSNFPKRNRVMAAISDATVIVEASDTSGTLHQAAECQRLKRWLFIMRAVTQDGTLHWPKRFLGQPQVGILTKTEDILARLL